LRGQRLLTEQLCALVPTRPAPTAIRDQLPPPLAPLPPPGFSEQAAVAIGYPQGQALRQFGALSRCGNLFPWAPQALKRKAGF
jgi:hypothetical protein